MLRQEKNVMHMMKQQVLICINPSPSYFVFVYEQLTLFKMKAIMEDHPHKITLIPEFLENFFQSGITNQHFLCELYLHEHTCQLEKRFNMTPFVGEIQLRTFTSFVNNQVTWLNSLQTVHTNEGASTLWIKSEL
jgi:hypothetical protein